MPHHQIRFDGESSAKLEGEVLIEICFNCDEIRSEHMKRSHIPSAWKQPLRDLFLSAGVPLDPPTREEMEQHHKELMRGGNDRLSAPSP